MKEFLRLFTMSLVLVNFLVIFMPVYSQTIEGRIIDNSNQFPLSGAEIITHGTKVVTITDEDGFFEFQAQEFPINVSIRFLGYEIYQTLISEEVSNLIIGLEASNIQLGEIVVSSYESKQKIHEIPGSIAVVSKKDLQMDNEVYIIPALNRIPGIHMQSGAYNTNRLTIRGIGSRSLYSTQKIKAYYDEIPLTTADGQTTVEDIDPNQIHRIEILKGPASSLYGAGLGGTLLIKSKRTRPNFNDISFQTTGGSFGYMKNALDFNYGTQKVNLNLSGNRIHSDGYRENNEYDRASIGLSGRVLLNTKTSMSFLSNYIDLLAFIPSSLSRTMYDSIPGAAAPGWAASRGFEDYYKWLTGIGISHTFDNSSLLDVSIFGNYLSSYERRPFNILTQKSRALGFRAKYSINTILGNIPSTIVIGTEFFNDFYDWQTWIREDLDKGNLISDNHEKRTYTNIFTKMDLQISEKSFISAGFNINQTTFNYNDIYSIDSLDDSGNYSFGIKASPRIGYSYSLNNSVNLFGSISHGFSPPTLQETLTPDGNINENIQPETGINYEAGIKGGLLDQRLYSELTFYVLMVDNLLVARRVGDDEFIGVNAGKTQHNGIEITSNYAFFNPKTHTNQLNGILTYSLNHFIFKEFIDDGNDYSGNELTGVPRQVLNIGLLWDFKALYGNITSQFVDRMPMRDDNSIYSDPYHLINAKLGYKINLGKSFTLDVYGIGNNILNKKYASQILVNASSFGGNQPRYYYPGLSRNYYLGGKIKYKF